MHTNVRCIRFAPNELPDDGPEVARWRTKYVPRHWRGIGDHVLYRHDRAEERNQRFANGHPRLQFLQECSFRNL